MIEINWYLILKQQLIFIEDTIFDEFNETNMKTKKILTFLSTLKVDLNSKILFVLTKPNREFWLATRNLKNVEVTVANCLNLDQLLKTNQIILSNTSLELITLTYGKSYA